MGRSPRSIRIENALTVHNLSAHDAYWVLRVYCSFSSMQLWQAYAVLTLELNPFSFTCHSVNSAFLASYSEAFVWLTAPVLQSPRIGIARRAENGVLDE